MILGKTIEDVRAVVTSGVKEIKMSKETKEFLKDLFWVVTFVSLFILAAPWVVLVICKYMKYVTGE